MIEAINKSAPVMPGSFTGDLRPQDLEQAAVQFEALFMRTLLAQMRKAAEALAAADDPFNSKQQRMMRDFYDDKLASTLASQRSSGIAHLLIQQLGNKSFGNGRLFKSGGEIAAYWYQSAFIIKLIKAGHNMNFIKIAFSGSQAAQANLAAAAMNTANTLTKGYSRQKALQSSVAAASDNMSAGNGVRVEGFQRISDEYLVKQEWDAISSKSYFDAKTHYLDKLEKTISSNETSLNSGFDKFYNSLSSLSSSPDNMPARMQFIHDAQALTLRFNNVNSEIENQKVMINNQREGIVNEVNMLTKAIANDNQQIEKNIYNGGNVNDLLDKRDEKVRELSKLIEVKTTKDDRGYLNVTLKGGVSLVNGMAASTLEAKMNGSKFNGLQLTFANNIFDADSSCGSQLGGINDYQLGVLQDTQDNVNTIAQQFASEFNSTLNAGSDLAGAAGADLFSFNANPNKVLQVTSIKPEELALAESGSPSGDNKNVAKLIDTRIKMLTGLGNKSINDSYTMLVSEFAVLNRENKIELNDKTNTLVFSTQQRESVSGVNMDEEGRSLIEYQSLYQANVRVMNMGNKLFTDLLALF